MNILVTYFIKENRVNFSNNTEIFSQAKALMLCVKPQDIKTVLETNSKVLTKDHLLISVAAGTRLEKIEKVFLVFSIYQIENKKQIRVP